MDELPEVKAQQKKCGSAGFTTCLFASCLLPALAHAGGKG